jgi:hypothetical protein
MTSAAARGGGAFPPRVVPAIEPIYSQRIPTAIKGEFEIAVGKEVTYKYRFEAGVITGSSETF